MTETINNDKLNQAITDLNAEAEADHERNINDMTPVDEYKSPGKRKMHQKSTIRNIIIHMSTKMKYVILDKEVEVSKDPIIDTHVCNTSVGIVSVKPDAVGVGIIGRGITKGVINRGTSIVNNVITDILTDSSKIIFRTDMFPLDPFKSQTLVIASQNKTTLSCNRIVRASSDIGNSMIYYGRMVPQL